MVETVITMESESSLKTRFTELGKGYSYPVPVIYSPVRAESVLICLCRCVGYLGLGVSKQGN